MTEGRQTVQAVIPSTRWHYLLLVGCLLTPTIAVGQREKAELKVSAVAELPGAGDASEGRRVLVEGEVVEVKHYPEVLNGVSVYSFLLSDGTGQVRVLSPMASMFAAEDLVRVEGVYHGPRSESRNGAHVDASEGTIEVLEASQSKVGKLLRRPPEEALSVPVSVATTRLSRSAEVASILSAVFALFAASVLVLQKRFFKIGLTLDILRYDLLSQVGWLRVVVRATSTGSHPPQVRPEAVLKIPRFGRICGSVLETNREAGRSAAVLPVPVFSMERLCLEFPIPKDVRAEDLGKAKLVLRDVLCRKRFVLKLESGESTGMGTVDLPGTDSEGGDTSSLEDDLRVEALVPRTSGKTTAVSALAALTVVLAFLSRAARARARE